MIAFDAELFTRTDRPSALHVGLLGMIARIKYYAARSRDSRVIDGSSSISPRPPTAPSIRRKKPSIAAPQASRHSEVSRRWGMYPSLTNTESSR